MKAETMSVAERGGQTGRAFGPSAGETPTPQSQGGAGRKGRAFGPSRGETPLPPTVRSLVAMVVGVLALLVGVAPVRGEAFYEAVDLKVLETVSVQDNQTLKTLDTFARQRLSIITGKTRIDGQGALPVVLDMCFRPEMWRERNVVRIKNVPLRKDFAEFGGIGDAEKKRILEEGTVSLAFLQRDDVQHFLEKLAGEANFKATAVSELQNAGAGLLSLVQSGGLLPVAVIPPVAEGDQNWKQTPLVMANVPKYAEMLKRGGAPSVSPQPGYAGREAALERAIDAQLQLMRAWRDQSPSGVNGAAVTMASSLREVNPVAYPSEIKRRVEVVYNRLAKLTIPAAFVYFAAFTLFLLAVYSGATGLRIWGLRLFVVAFVIHTVAIGIRWWLISKSVGNWFESIPIKNQFESVLFSSWFGGLVGLALEVFYRRQQGIWGAAAAFVGWLSLVAIFSAPFVAGRDIGGEIGMVNGVLMSYWLYIHVTLVVASYALIGMSFMLGVWWLIKYYGLYETVSRVPARQLAGDPNKLDELSMPTGMGGAGALTMRQTLAALVFFPVARAETTVAAKVKDLPAEEKTKAFMATLDACHLVILQLAFWILGVGIILGAVWADQSWGRPWGWDPKETFALVTWIVYLAVVHIRLATEDKAWWTSVLAIVGFFVMLFNWIGVNFFLVGLHSYA